MNFIGAVYMKQNDQHAGPPVASPARGSWWNLAKKFVAKRISKKESKPSSDTSKYEKFIEKKYGKK